MKAKQIIIEIGADRLSFTVGKTAEPYDVNSSISMATICAKHSTASVF